MRTLVLMLVMAPVLAVAQAPPAANDGRGWMQRGVAMQKAGKLDEAIAAYEKAIALKFALPMATYNLATAYALKKDKDKAFATLEKAVQAGFARLADLETDPDLAGLRADPRWAQAVRRMDEVVHPCKSKPIHRELDFWVGEWEVRGPKGELQGTSSVQNIVEGCVIYENWTGASGHSGKSFNFYNADKKAWQQTWVDSQGGSLEFLGHLREGSMRYEGESLGADGKKSLQRLSFTPLSDGRVRQHWEQSEDAGKTWTTVFDGLYSRKK
jgi:tetratricopeptide (TPR) repeat protein